jgi:radical SAM superfamily enzyme YgiQ (UPF0313 family)
MKVKMILPSRVGAKSPYFRPIKYSLFPPLGLATLAAYLGEDDQVEIQDEHVERLDLDDQPDLVAIEVYISSAGRAYEIADQYRCRGVHVCLGGLHVTSCPDEAMPHADTIFLGPGEDTWPWFLADFAIGAAKPVYESTVRTLVGAPPPRRDLLKLHRYLVPNTIVVSRGCPHHCEFCYKDSFFEGGSGFYTAPVDDALRQIDALPGRHVYFLDDNLFADSRFAGALFEGMRGMGRLWQGAATVEAVLRPGLLEKAVAAGVRSLFIGFETLSEDNLRSVGKVQNLGRDYARAIRRLHEHGVMVNASFVFGMDGDGPDVFDRTVDWAVAQGIETATFHILTPYPGTALHERLAREGRILTKDWTLYDTRHAVFQPAGMTPRQLEAGHSRAYEQFYRWGRILEAACTKPRLAERIRHIMYTGGWKKCEPLWNVAIKFGHLPRFLPLLESVLSAFGRYGADNKHAARHERKTVSEARIC